jgi:RNA polymerase sigma-70 factor, ECF subfamily
MATVASITELLVAWGQGDRLALEQLTPQIYRELHLLAQAYLWRGPPNRTLQATELINEVFLKLLEQPHAIKFQDRAHFYGIAARLMRHILVDYARTHNAMKRSGARNTVTLEECIAVSPLGQPDVLEIDEALSRLAEVDERKTKVVELRYFGGMDREEIAAALDLTLATVKRDLRLGEAWLRRFLATASAGS